MKNFIGPNKPNGHDCLICKKPVMSRNLEETFCCGCSRAAIKEQDQFLRAQKTSHRKCTRCKVVLPKTRYFTCTACDPEKVVDRDLYGHSTWSKQMATSPAGEFNPYDKNNR